MFNATNISLKKNNVVITKNSVINLFNIKIFSIHIARRKENNNVYNVILFIFIVLINNTIPKISPDIKDNSN